MHTYKIIYIYNYNDKAERYFSHLFIEQKPFSFLLFEHTYLSLHVSILKVPKMNSCKGNIQVNSAYDKFSF